MADEYKQPPELEEDPELRDKSEGPLWEVKRFRLKPRNEKEKDREAARKQTARAVLLIHAATVSRRMFMEPAGGFLKYLLDEETEDEESKIKQPAFDVYTLDWRSSNLLFKNWGEGGLGRKFDDYRVDRVAEDVRDGIRAVSRFRKKNGAADSKVHVVAHCMGAASTAQALATPPDTPEWEEPLPVGNVVLATIALFYRLGGDGFLKLADDRFAGLEPGGRIFISPHVVDEPDDPELLWPKGLENMFELWRETVLSHGCSNSFCDRLWFLYGGDYRAMDMLAIHDASPGGLRAHFGAMPVGLYRHAIENCRRGWAAPWDGGPGDVDRFLDPRRFEKRSITLISGTENQVWHRDSVDRMYEWLRRTWPHDKPEDGRIFRKRVFPRYGHIDLFWSSEAHREVFPYLVESLLLNPGKRADG
jgi:pimeloyl-ACP methyl ester carboxylesterase